MEIPLTTIYKRVYRVVIAILLLLLTSWPYQEAQAIAPPSAPSQIIRVDVYEHNLELNDQLYLIEFQTTYTVNPTENITQSFLIRLINSVSMVEYAQVVPYNYYNKGYGHWVASIYIPAASAPTWASTSYSMRLEGNPALTWTGSGLPVYSFPIPGTSDVWHATTAVGDARNIIAARIRELATKLEADWPFDFIEGVFAAKLTATYGVEYFTNVIANLYLIAPDIMPTSITKPSTISTREKSFTKTHSNALEGKSLGPQLDSFFNSGLMGMSPLLMKSVVGLALYGLTAGIISWKVNNPRPAMYCALPFGIALAYVSLGTIVFWGLMAMFAVIAFAFVFMFKRAG